MFDNYTLKARFYPIIILFFPLILLGVFYSFEFKTTFHLLSSIGLVGALTYLFSQLGRDMGKSKEPFLWQYWGGAPTIQILRLRNSHIDSYTKKRYHDKLGLLCPVSISPDILMETNNPTEADEVYKAWTKYLITHTRDSKKYDLLLKDNTSYGFRRNLWGLKPYASLLISLLLVGNYFFWVHSLKLWNPLLFPKSFQYSSLALLFILLFWLIVIKKDWIKIPAFSYAERLCETIDSL